MKDKPICKVVEEVCDEMTERANHGYIKYGVTVADNQLPLIQWAQHGLEESMDKTVYDKKQMQLIQTMTEIMPVLSVWMEKHNDPNYVPVEGIDHMDCEIAFPTALLMMRTMREILLGK